MSTNQTAAAARTSPAESRPIVGSERRTTGAAFRWLLWSPAIAIVLSALAIPGGLVFFGLPLLALGYFVFALLAQNGPDGLREPALQSAHVHDHTRPHA